MAPDKVVAPAPDCVSAPAPLITPECVTALLRLKTSVPLLITSPAMAPDVLPSPNCKVPALRVVAPV